MHHEAWKEYSPSDSVSFNVTNVVFKDSMQGYETSNSNNDTAKEAMNFSSQVTIMNHLG